LTLELADGALVADALGELDWLIGDLRAVLAVNREYASEATVLQPDDELALIPPVSGGAPGASIHVAIRDTALAADAITAIVSDARAGAVVTFQGVTREVPALEYEAYTEMAEAKIAEIAAVAADHHGLCAVAVEHRLGTVALSEPSVVIAVSAAHRGEAFAGAREIIDALKQQVPIWKREEGEWVRGHSPH
jgi:molybdopterin synthase catalytic subunit